MNGKYILNPNTEKVEKVQASLRYKEEAYGERYCPCVLKTKHGPDTICPCKEYRETGHCRCGLYIE